MASQYADASDKNPDIKESHDLIASDRVEGTKVYSLRGEHIGHIERVLLEKRSGKVSYAVLAFGGFMGMGHEHYPLPWSKLDYDEDLNGYSVDVNKEQLEGAPKYHDDDDFIWTPERGRQVYDYYGIAPYWV
ncbi:PRC-barrel domain-containing protein [Devosia algicola]|uniref:PRC-barrel domain-containing protein n=1 Tax=Devosia algicola TaxID=3026418 RepID=A0ABY7YP33_9HYPH|nr:PRC-barrel domain-containing protein [Devosia algicola]WDR02830.1 PRC-barrel domain-containing protein [Devosia algicola]